MKTRMTAENDAGSLYAVRGGGQLEFTHFLTSKTHLTPMDKGEGAFS